MKIGFKEKILLSSGGFLAIALLIFSTVSYNEMKKTLVKELENKQFSQTESLRIDVDSWLENKLDVTKALSHSLSKLDTLNKETMTPLLALTKGSIEADAMYVGLEDGTILFANGRKMSAGYDPRVRPWYIKATKEKKAILTDIYIDVTSQEPTISGAIPITVNGVTKGVVAFDLSIAVITKKVFATKFEGGYAFILDKDGKSIIHPNKEYQGNDLWT